MAGRERSVGADARRVVGYTTRKASATRDAGASGTAGRTCNFWKQSARQRSERTPQRCNGTHCRPGQTSRRRGGHTTSSPKYPTRIDATPRKQFALSIYWAATEKAAGSSSTVRLIARVSLLRHKVRASAPYDRVQVPKGGANQTEISHRSYLAAGSLTTERHTRASAQPDADSSSSGSDDAGGSGRLGVLGGGGGGVKVEGTVHGLIPLTQVVDV